MAKVITFSRTFPAYHPRKGQPTNFVEQFYNSIFEKEGDWSSAPGGTSSYVVELNHLIRTKKHHTIRAGHRFKAGDYFSPRVWGTDINPKSGKSGPYNSKQIILAPDIEIKKVWDFEIRHEFDKDDFYNFFYLNDNFLRWTDIELIAKNDGLSLEELVHWFKSNDGYFNGKIYNCNFKGQVICWNDKINY